MKKSYLIGLITSLLILAFAVTAVNDAQAAIGTGNATCTANTPKSAGTALTCTVATEAFEAGNIAVLLFAGDNIASGAGLTSVSDNQGNPPWTVQRCFTNPANGAAKGATTCIAWTKLTNALPIGATITANFASITAKTMVVKEFTIVSGNSFSAVTAVDLAESGNPSSMTINTGLTGISRLYLRSTAMELSTPNWIQSGGYTSTGCSSTSGGGGDSNMAICGEFLISTATSSASDPSASNSDCASIFIAFDEITPAGTPSKLAITTQPSSSATNGIAFLQQPVIQLQDGSSNPVSQSDVIITAAIQVDAGGTLGGTLTATTNASGTATFTNLVITGTAGSYTLRFTATGLTPVDSGTITLGAGAATKLRFYRQPGSAIMGNIIPSTLPPDNIQVEILDANDNRVTTGPDATKSITIAIANNPGTPTPGTLSGTTPKTASAGVAEFSDLSIDNSGSDYTLRATSPALTEIISDAFNISTGAFGLTECMADRAGQDFEGGLCGAQDVRLTGLALADASTTSCIGGEIIIVDLIASLNFGANPKYDAGIFIANDGGSMRYRSTVSPLNNGAGSCSVSILPTGPSPFMDNDGDICGDSGGSGTPSLPISGVPVLCKADAESNGKLFIPFSTSWFTSGSDPTPCTSATQPYPSSGSKCNVPSVLSSTVNVIVLPKVTKTRSATTPTPGQCFTYTVKIINNTGVLLNGATFQDNPSDPNLILDTCAPYSLTCCATGGAACPGCAATCPDTCSVSAATIKNGVTIPDMPINTAQAITNITQANPAVVTYSGADTYATGDRVTITGVRGMTQLNNGEFTVGTVITGAKTFELSGINSIDYTAYTAGSGKITELSTLTFVIPALNSNPTGTFSNEARVDRCNDGTGSCVGIAAGQACGDGSGTCSGPGAATDTFGKGRVKIIKWREVFR